MSLAIGIAPGEIEKWPAEDLIDFIEYDRIQPFGSERDNWHAAMIAQIIAAVNTPKRRKPPSVSDFMFVDKDLRQSENIQQADSFFAKAGQRGKSR